MRNYKNRLQKVIMILGVIIYTSIIINAQTSFYWGGGSGDWNDPNNWFKEETLINLTGSIPNKNTVVHFTDKSSTVSNWTVTIPPGSYDVLSILVQTQDDFLIKFDGVDNDVVVMNVYKNLSLKSTHRLEYATSTNPSNANNKWVFAKISGQQNISTGNHDLLRVEFKEDGVTFNQMGHIKASQQIHMYNGTWNTNGYNVNAGVLLFNDGLPSNITRPPKIFNTGGSNILCDEWDSRNTYGSLTLVGSHAIFVSEFKGSPANGGSPFLIDKIHLLEYPDNTDGSTSAVDHANFECKDCLIETMIIEDTGRAILAGGFTINGKFTVVEQGVKVEFNGSNGRSNEVVFNGTIITPAVNSCDDKRTVFTNIYNDFTQLIRNSGALQIEDAVLNNIQATGNASFTLSGGVIQGSSSGWNITSPPNSIDYYWLGDNGSAKDWNNPNYWTRANGTSNGCIPSIVDDVFIDSGSKGNIRIPENYTAECRNFIWTNEKNLELTMDGTFSLESKLKISGSFELEQSAKIIPVFGHQLIFSSSSSNTIITHGVQLPNVKFLGDKAEWALLDDFSCDRLDFEAGTFKTQGSKVTTDLWTSIENNPKHYDFGSSNIVVNGTFTLSQNSTNGVTVDPGTSKIECETLTSSVTDLYDVQMNNASVRTLGNYPYNFNKLILNGAGQVSTQNNLTLETLQYKMNAARLNIDKNYSLIINHGIISQTSQNSPGELRSKTSGTQATVNSDGNICVAGHVSFTDINAVLTGVFHAPYGIDGGNNHDIIYDSGATSDALYWIAENGGTWQIQNNWSRIDGGCPADKNPADSQNLIFNRNSFNSTTVTVTIPYAETANNIYFENTESLTVNVRETLTMGAPNLSKDLIVNGGHVSFIGKTLNVSGKIDIQSGGFMTTSLRDCNASALDASSGIFILRVGSNVKIE